MGLKVSAEDTELVKPLLDILSPALSLTNDYWSWDREHEASKSTGPGRIVNVIAVIMKERCVSVEEAKAITKQLIIDLEGQYVRARDQFFITNPGLPFRIRKWIEACELVVSGHNYWAATCPRYHAWRQPPETGCSGKYERDG
jgi:hypothetical protein